MDATSTQFDSNMALLSGKLVIQQAQMKNIFSSLTMQNDILSHQGSTLAALQAQGLAHVRRFDDVDTQLRRQESQLQGFRTAVDLKLEFLCADLNDARAKLAQLPNF